MKIQRRFECGMKDFGEDMKIKFVQSQEQASVEISLGVVIFEGK